MLYIFSSYFSLSIKSIFCFSMNYNQLPEQPSFHNRFFFLLLTILNNRSKNRREKDTVFYIIYSLYNIIWMNNWVDLSNSNCRISIFEAEQFYMRWTYKCYALQLNFYSLYTMKKQLAYQFLAYYFSLSNYVQLNKIQQRKYISVYRTTILLVFCCYRNTYHIKGF